MFKTIAAITFLTVTTAGAVLAGELVNTAGASNIAVSGYDTVAFFTEGKPVHGDPGITAEHEGATYLFASEENKALFEQSPEKYAPQFGGYCAYGAAVGALFPVDVSTWQIKDDKLYLNLNPEVLKAFNADLEGNIAKAQENWPSLKEKHAE